MAILHRSGVPRHQVEDLCQDILIKIWQSIESFEYNPDKCRFRTWLSTVCRNKIYEFFELRKYKSSGEESDALIMITEKAEIDQIIEREWQLFLVGKAFDKVKKSFNDKAIQAYLEFQQEKEVSVIAKLLELSESSVYVYNKRVKDALTREIILLSNELD